MLTDKTRARSCCATGGSAANTKIEVSQRAGRDIRGNGKPHHDAAKKRMKNHTYPSRSITNNRYMAGGTAGAPACIFQKIREEEILQKMTGYR